MVFVFFHISSGCSSASNCPSLFDSLCVFPDIPAWSQWLPVVSQDPALGWSHLGDAEAPLVTIRLIPCHRDVFYFHTNAEGQRILGLYCHNSHRNKHTHMLKELSLKKIIITFPTLVILLSLVLIKKIKRKLIVIRCLLWTK